MISLDKWYFNVRFPKLILPPWIGGRSVKNVEKSPRTISSSFSSRNPG